jgi:RNA polymerase sigma factor (sigma-70 family)
LNGCVDAMDDAAFEALYDRHHRNLLAFCRHMLGSREEAEDALQHTFLAAYRSLPDGDDVRVKPWLYAVARNRCLSVLRARRDAVALDEGMVATDGLVAEVHRRDDLRALVRDVQRLPPDQREALLLFELGDSPHEEIATILGVRKEKVKALVFQARETLMGWRAARETPCEEVREQLATLRGSALRRASIRRHVEQCAGCAEYETGVQRQRAALAVALPVVPAAGLKASVLSSVLGGSGAAVGATAATSGLASVGAKGIAAKVLAVVAIAGGAGTGGYVAVEELQQDHGTPPARAERAAAAVRATPVALDTPAPAIVSTIAARRTGAAAEPTSPAAKPKAKRARGRALGTKAAHGKAAAPGQLKAPGTPAQGKALGHVKQKPRPVTPAATKRATKKPHKAHKPKHVAAKPAPKTTPAPRGNGAASQGNSGGPKK